MRLDEEKRKGKRKDLGGKSEESFEQLVASRRGTDIAQGREALRRPGCLCIDDFPPGTRHTTMRTMYIVLTLQLRSSASRMGAGGNMGNRWIISCFSVRGCNARGKMRTRTTVNATGQEDRSG